MPATNATILIPDISGFTDFMSSTELEHGTHIISSFLDTIIKQVGDEFEIAEIEGDAVLLYKKGKAPTRQELTDLCLRMFEAFHYQRKTMQQMVLCPCGACQGLIDLSLKFIAHRGVISEINVDRFTKATGLDMIIAHRLLKNSIGSNEYILMSENFLKEAVDDPGQSFSWLESSEEFPAIGKVDYRFALLDDVKARIPEPPRPSFPQGEEEITGVEALIDVPVIVAYACFIDMPNRVHWVNRLKRVEQQDDRVYIGSVHVCRYDTLTVTITPIRIQMGEQEIIYSEKSYAQELQFEAIYECRFREFNGKCQFNCRVKGGTTDTPPPQTIQFLSEELQRSTEKFKEYAEDIYRSSE